MGKRFKVNIPWTEELFVCFVPFPAPGLTDSLRSLGWQYPACRDQETDHSLSVDVPGIPRGSVPCRGGALGFTEITTPIVKTVVKCKAICCRLYQLLEPKFAGATPLLYMKMTELQENNVICGFYLNLMLDSMSGTKPFQRICCNHPSVISLSDMAWIETSAGIRKEDYHTNVFVHYLCRQRCINHD